MALPKASRRNQLGPWQWVLASGALLLLVILVGVGAWGWRSSYHTRGRAELALATHRTQNALGPEGTAESRRAAIAALQAVIERYPRLGVLPQAAYQLGNVHYEAQEYEQAREAYQLALDKGAEGSLATLTRLGIAYSWEAQGEPSNALGAFQTSLEGLSPDDFLYEELMLGVARSHELLGERGRAMDTYRRLLKERPQSSRAREIRVLVASLTEAPGR
ncbi:MAG: tetratricopeptide repeat protein [Candidatus Methylomirabilia bacterium]